MKILENAQINQLLDTVKKQQHDIEELSKGKESRWSAIHEKLRYSWTYNSNAIEGSTLSEGDTIFFLQEGLTVEGKPFKDYLDAKNHQEAIEYLYELIQSNSPVVSVGLIKEFNALLLSGINFTKAIDPQGKLVNKPATPGEYKKNPNHVIQADKTIHYYAEPLQVEPEMDKLVTWINDNIDELHPVVVGAVAHYEFVKIHPFDDGNGRGARLLMNLIFIKKRLPPAIIYNSKRRKYIQALVQADKGNINLFVEFVCASLIETQKIIIEELRN